MSETLDHIAEDLRALAFLVTALNPAPNNARRHAPADVAVIAESLRTYGQRKPVVGKREYRGVTNAVIAGNGTLAAAPSLGWTHVAVSWFDGSDEDAQRYALVDNRSAELSEWNLEELASQLRDIQIKDADLPAALGWGAEDLMPLLQAQWTAPAIEPLPADGVDAPLVSIEMTRGQHLVVARAISRLREHERDPAMSDGRALELICADALAGPLP